MSASNQQLDQLWLRGNQAWEQGMTERAAEIFYQAIVEEQGGADFYLALYALTENPEYMLLGAEQAETVGQQSSLTAAHQPVCYRPSLSQSAVISTPGDLIRARDVWRGAASEELDDYDHQAINDLTRATLALYRGEYRQVLAIVEGLDLPGYRSDLDFLLGAALIAVGLPEVGEDFLLRAQELGLGPEAQELATAILETERWEDLDICHLLQADRQRQEFNQVVAQFYCSEELVEDSVGSKE
jgi:hypothetical protein